MTELDRVFSEFVQADRAGDRPDPLEYLERFEGTDRRELATLIDGYLARAPRRGWDAAEHASSGAKGVVEQLDRSLAGVSGLWPALLPRLRATARVKRSDLVAQLAAALGVSDREQKVAAYYHEMEQGLLPAAGVSTRVLEVLGSIVGESAEALRGAGQALRPSDGGVGEALVFARTATLDETFERPATPEPAVRADEGPWDDVDELFRGGG